MTIDLKKLLVLKVPSSGAAKVGGGEPVTQVQRARNLPLSIRMDKKMTINLSKLLSLKISAAGAAKVGEPAEPGPGCKKQQ